MDLLLQQFGDSLKAEVSGSLDKDNLVAQLVEGGAGEEVLGGGEEEFLSYEEGLGLSRYFVADADKLVDAALHAEVVHLTIEFAGRFAALVDVAQDERAAAALLVGTATHEVEGYVERVDIAVIGIVNQCATALSPLHFQAHGDGVEVRHTFCQVGGRQSQMKDGGGTDDAVVDTGIVDEGDGIVALLAFIDIGDMSRLAVDGLFLDEESCLAVGTRPAYLLALILQTTDATTDGIVV